MEEATRLQKPEYDWFDSVSQDPIEYGGQSLQRGEAENRLTAILNISALNGDDLFAEQYKFKCPYN